MDGNIHTVSMWKCIYEVYSMMGVWIQYLYENACIYKGCSIMIIDSSAFLSTNEDKQDDEGFIEHSGKKKLKRENLEMEQKKYRS